MESTNWTLVDEEAQLNAEIEYILNNPVRPAEKKKWVFDPESDDEESFRRKKEILGKKLEIERLMYYCVLDEEMIEITLGDLKDYPAAWLRAKQWFSAKKEMLQYSWKQLLESSDVDLSDMGPFLIQIPRDSKVRVSLGEEYRSSLDNWSEKANDITMEIFNLRNITQPMAEADNSFLKNLAKDIFTKVDDQVFKAFEIPSDTNSNFVEQLYSL